MNVARFFVGSVLACLLVSPTVSVARSAPTVAPTSRPTIIDEDPGEKLIEVKPGSRLYCLSAPKDAQIGLKAFTVVFTGDAARLPRVADEIRLNKGPKINGSYSVGGTANAQSFETVATFHTKEKMPEANAIVSDKYVIRDSGIALDPATSDVPLLTVTRDGFIDRVPYQLSAGVLLETNPLCNGLH